MKKNKFLAWIMLVTIILGNLGMGISIKANPTVEIEVEKDSQSKNPSSKGETFLAYLTVTSDEEIEINASNVELISTTNFSKNAEPKVTRINKGYYEIVLSLRYQGTGSGTLPVNITYVYGKDENNIDGTTSTYTKKIEIELSEPTTNPPTETQPEVIVNGTLSVINAKAGDTINVSVPIKAVNWYLSSPVVSLDMDNTVFSLASTGNMSSINYITVGETVNVRFDLKIKETTPSGEYKINLGIATKDSTGSSYNITLPTPVIVFVEEKTGPIVTVASTNYPQNLTREANFDLVLGLKNIGDATAKNVKVSITGYGTDGFVPRYSSDKMAVADITTSFTQTISLPIQVSKSASEGLKVLTVNVSYKDLSGSTVTDTNDIYISVVNQKKPYLELTKSKYPNKVELDDKFNLILTFENAGEIIAKDIYFIMEGYGTDSFVPDYKSEKLYMEDLKSGNQGKITIPIKVTDTATTGTKTLIVKGIYTDNFGEEYSVTNTIYINVLGNAISDVNNKPELIISTVNQSPLSPSAGDRMSVSFILQNNSKVDINDFKISITNLSNANFSPINSEPYQYIKTIKAGGKVKITMPLRVSENVTEGLNELMLQFDYEDKMGVGYSDTARIFILDVRNDEKITELASMPKIIISNFTTDPEELKAGQIFSFNFNALNTHESLSAENIKVTITSPDNVFSVTKGGNSFYINKIKPQETETYDIELKIKSDSMTKAYPIDIEFEYEYVGLKENVIAKETVTVKETINLQVTEFSRPVVNNIGVGYYEAPQINIPTNLSFEFYNMGQSVLRNVSARVEGDFMPSSNMLYIGNVEAGNYADMQEMEVTPLIEGTAQGTLIISYEDSNGDIMEFSTPFETFVQGEAVLDWQGGDEFPGMMPEPEVKKAILSVPIFVILQIVVLILGILIARAITLGLHKRKLRKMEDEF